MTESYLQDADFTLYNGDAVEVLRELPAESVHMCVTSPPFFGLRDYGTGTWEGGDARCDHVERPARNDAERGRAVRGNGPDGGGGFKAGDLNYRNLCGKCGARRVDRQIGLEATPEEWVASLVAVFREVHRVLRNDGVLFIEIGDSYQDKQLLGQPDMLKNALKADGWVHRNSCVWERPNPMPESVRDRFTVSHSTVLFFAKAAWVGPERTHFDTLNESDKRWLAAMIDTEGSILVRRSRVKSRNGQDYNDAFAAQVAFVNTNTDLIAEVQRLSGDAWYCKPRNNPTGLPCFHMAIQSQKAAGLLRALYPHLIAKRRQARIALYAQSRVRFRGKRFLENKRRSPDEQALLERCWQASKDCNQGRDPELSWVPEPKLGKWVPQRYFFDAEAVREAWSETSHGSARADEGEKQRELRQNAGGSLGIAPGKPRGPDGRQVTTVQQGNGSIQHRDGERWPERPQTVRAKELFRDAGLTEAHLTAIKAVGMNDAGKAQVNQDGFGKNTPEMQRLADEAKDALGGYYREFLLPPAGRNARSVWTIPTEPLPFEHYAAFPQALAERCIKAGTSERGCCPECGAPWVREVDVIQNGKPDPNARKAHGGIGNNLGGARHQAWRNANPPQTTGWRPSCDCAWETEPKVEYPPSPCTILDPFLGSGTSALVARRLNRRCIGIELNPKYCELIARRTQQLSLEAEATA